MTLFSLDRYPTPAALRTELRRLGISLNPQEVQDIRTLLGRDPSIVELYLFNGEWSEHCSYKSSRRLLQQYMPVEGPTIMLGVGEDAGILHLTTWKGERIGLVIAHESHNHPSQVLPVEGAATGIGGVVRDVACMGARVIGVLDPLRFGDPNGPNKERTRWIISNVVEGIMEYGNALGVPNLGGDVYFNESFDDNCLVNVVAVGVLKESEIIHSRVPQGAATEPYDVILIGKSTDSSGFGGAAFASGVLEGAEDIASRGAVQVHDPFLENVLVTRKANHEVFERARERGVPLGFKDLGAAGIGCAAAELCEAGGFGVTLQLDKVPVALPNLPPEVIALAETQERFLLACPQSFTPEVLAIYNEEWELPRIYPGAGAAVIGQATIEKQYSVFHFGEKVADAPIEAVVKGIRVPRESQPRSTEMKEESFPEPKDYGEILLQILSDPTIASKEEIFRFYDTEVQGQAVLRPGEGDATVIAPLWEEGSPAGAAFSVDGNPFYGRLDPYWGGATAVAEAIRNVIAVGGVPLGLTDCLNYGNPENPQAFWQLEEGIRGIADAAKGLTLLEFPGEATPIVSGNVSLYNESSNGTAIDPSPVICCAGKLEDYSQAVTLRVKKPGNSLWLIGERRKELGGSAYLRARGLAGLGKVVTVDFAQEDRSNRAVHACLKAGLAEACHDISDGGVCATIAEMVIASSHLADFGARIEVPSGPLRMDEWLFSETGGYVLEISEKNESAFQKICEEFRVIPVLVGKVTDTSTLEIVVNGASCAALATNQAVDAWKGGLRLALNK